jgi:hypothetical protein
VASQRPFVARRRPALRTVLATCLVAAYALVGCTASSSPVAPTPADFGGISQVLRARGISIVDVVSGDAGCPDTSLARAAIRFRMSGLDQASPVTAYLYVFGSQAAFERRASDVATCARSYVTDPSSLESIDVSPYVMAGQGPWAPGLRAQVRAGLAVAAGNGGNGTGPGGGPP